MNGIKKWIILGVTLALMTNGAFYAVKADYDEHRKMRWYQKFFDSDSDDNDSDSTDLLPYTFCNLLIKMEYITFTREFIHFEQC